MSGVKGGSDPADPMSWEWILRNRRSVNIDLRHPDGPEMVRRLASVSDVVLENFGSGTAERLGIGYKALSRDNPGLVMISMPPAGRHRTVVRPRLLRPDADRAQRHEGGERLPRGRHALRGGRRA